LPPLHGRLEASGFLSRRRAAENERSLALELTDAGAALKKEAMSVPGTMMQNLGSEPDDVVQLHRAMTPLIAATKTEHTIPETTNS
jgi:DNA-binding MarR family transcriptional regulator